MSTLACNVLSRLARDRANGVETTERALDFVRRVCPCERCASRRSRDSGSAAAEMDAAMLRRCAS